MPLKAVAIFSVIEAIICLFDTIGVFQGANGILKIHAMQPSVGRGFDLGPFVTHTVPIIGVLQLSKHRL